DIRLGIHSGPMVAGVVGEKKFAYDIWGDTVNTAARLESSGTPGKINISGSTYTALSAYFDCEHRGKIAAKNKDDMEMYYLHRLKAEYATDKDGIVPNAQFWQAYERIYQQV
ncbi:MAG TPA: adenylate/guanylate cyclase domain-containing protein, partial [Turneriella sp.]|nr:adenylate/guanylate cyclase domain-containing protein [Turneriella sp.]